MGRYKQPESNVIVDRTGDDVELTPSSNFPVSIEEAGIDVPTTIPGTISTGNSTTSNLGNGGVFTGAWEEITDYAIIKVGIYSDQDAAASGVCFQQSPDQVVIFDEPYGFTAGGKKLWTPNPVLRYFRVVYTNGTTPTTSFGIQTIYSAVYAKPTSHRLGDTVTSNDDTELTKSVISYLNENDSNYNNVGIQNPLPVDGDSVYAKDVWLEQSDEGDFSGEVTDLFDNLQSVIVDSTANDPKDITIQFNRTVVSNTLGLGAYSGNFSNTEIQLGTSGGTFVTVVDESADSTKYTTRTFQLPITAGFNAVKLLFHTTDTVTLSNCVILKTRGVVSRIQGVTPDNVVEDVVVTEDGYLSVSDTSSGLAIAGGEVSGKTFEHKFGNAPDFDTADGVVTVWDGADDGDIAQMDYVYSTTADIDSLSSSSAADTQDIKILGLNSSYVEVEQTITLNGQTRVALTTSLLRVFRMINVGSTDNAGHIYCYVNGAITAGVPDDPTDVRAIIQPGNNQTLMALYTVPDSKTAYMRDWFAATAGGNKNSTYIVDLRARPTGEVFQLKHRSSVSDFGSSHVQHKYEEPEVFEARTDIEMRVESVASPVATGISFSAGFDLVLVDD